MPSWVAGISIGAVNSAIIAGNPPEKRIERLREFWERVSSRLLAWPLSNDDNSRRIFNETSATLAAVGGVPGFFEPRVPPAVFQPQGTPEAISVYDTNPLRRRCSSLSISISSIPSAVRLSVGAVQVITGNMKYFDTAKQFVGPEHVMASGALPPGFRPSRSTTSPIGTAGSSPTRRSNMCSSEADPREDMVIFQVDLFSARGCMPQTLFDIGQRKRRSAIRAAPGSTPTFSARCRPSAGPSAACGGDVPAELQRQSRLAAARRRELATRRSPSCSSFTAARPTGPSPTTTSSRATRWTSIGSPASRTSSSSFNHPDWKNRTRPEEGVKVLDLTRDLDTDPKERVLMTIDEVEPRAFAMPLSATHSRRRT